MTGLSADDEDLAIDYALGLCEGGDETSANTLMALNRAFALSVNDWREKLTDIDLSAAPQPLPADSWAMIARRLEPRTLPRQATGRTIQRLRTLWGELTFWRPAALALSFIVMVATLALLFVANPGPSLIAVLETPEGRPGAIVTISGKNSIVLVPLQTIAPDESSTLEVWTLQLRDRGPVSIGRMASARRLVLDPSRIGPAAEGHLFEITLEPAGGSPTGRPTGPVLMKGLARMAL